MSLRPKMKTLPLSSIDQQVLPTINEPQVRATELRDLCKVVDAALQTLTKRERQVLELRYGIGGHTQEYTYAEIARQLKISTTRIQQLEEKALTKLLRDPTYERLKPYLDERLCERYSQELRFIWDEQASFQARVNRWPYW